MPCCHEFKKHEGEIDYEEIEACYNKLRETDDFFGSKRDPAPVVWREERR